MTKILTRLIIATALVGAAVTQVGAQTLDFRGTALPTSQGNIMSYIDGSELTTSFESQPVDLLMTLAGSAGSLYVSAFSLTWSGTTYDLPFIAGWSGPGFPDKPLFDNVIGNESAVGISSSGGGISIHSTSAYVGFYDSGLNFTLNYNLGSPHGVGSSFTDNTVTGGGSILSGVEDSYQPNVGPYNASSDVTFSLSSVTQVGGVPEPRPWALLLVGFGALGGIARQRRRVRDLPGIVSVSRFQ